MSTANPLSSEPARQAVSVHPYASADYANAFGPGFMPLYLPEAQTFVLKRRIPQTDACDAMGCYPLSPIAPGSSLSHDFAALKAQGIVSLVWVADPFFSPPAEALKHVFDHVLPYKEHYVHDFSKGGYDSRNHRYKVNRSLKSVEVRWIDLPDHLDTWWGLYRALIAKHDITGIQAFSREYFAALCALKPFMFGAFNNGELVSAKLCFVHQGYAYCHLVVSSEEGYRLRAAYALYDYALKHFAAAGMKAYDMGAGAGVTSASEGLAQFKRGFSNTLVTCHLYGKILDTERYAELSQGRKTAFFPAYREA